MSIIIDDIEYDVVNEFPVLHLAWEADSVGYVALSPDKRHILILSNHGQYYIAKKEELEAKIRFYEGVLFKTKLALGTIDE